MFFSENIEESFCLFLSNNYLFTSLTLSLQLTDFLVILKRTLQNYSKILSILVKIGSKTHHSQYVNNHSTDYDYIFVPHMPHIYITFRYLRPSEYCLNYNDRI